jgi:hypothetical protein
MAFMVRGSWKEGWGEEHHGKRGSRRDKNCGSSVEDFLCGLRRCGYCRRSIGSLPERQEFPINSKDFLVLDKFGSNNDFEIVLDENSGSHRTYVNPKICEALRIALKPSSKRTPWWFARELSVSLQMFGRVPTIPRVFE